MTVSACAERGSADAPRRARGPWGAPRLARCAAVGAFTALGLLSRPASAQSPDSIRVERQPGAEDCPDTGALASRVAALLGRPSDPMAPPYLVTFARTSQAFTAAIRSADESAIVRRLSAREPNCAALAHATAVALAVLLDADLSAKLGASNVSGTSDASDAAIENGAEPPTPQPAAPPSPASEAPAPEPERTPWLVDPFASIGAGAAVGVLRPASFALIADVGFKLGGFRGSVGALWLTPQTLELAPGSAREHLISASLRACYLVTGSAVLRLDACAGAFLGAAQAEAQGFAQNMQHSELFLAFPAGLAVAVGTGPVSWELAASALLVCPPNEFNVVGRGATYQPPPVAGLLTLSVSIERSR
jgi:hypothetical protein